MSGDAQANAFVSRDTHWLHTAVTIIAVLALVLIAGRNGELSDKLRSADAALNAQQEWCELVYAHLVKIEESTPHCPKPK